MTTDPVPPRRSIVSVLPVPGGVEITCDCATATVLRFDAVPAESVEMAFTCDGCLSVHWYRLVPAAVEETT